MATNKLPRFQISVNPEDGDGEELGMTQIAYTATPAILVKGLAFNLNKTLVFADELKYRLAAPAMIPDIPIYREDNEMGSYEVVFTKEVIEKLRSDFMAKKAQAQFNIEHDSNVEAPSYILDSWITGPSESDPSFTKYGIQVPEGSWFVVSQFTDKEFFNNEILAKDRVGYSIEGFLGLSLSQFTQITKENKTQNKMKLKFEMAKLADGTSIWISSMEVGAEVYTIDENLEKVPVFDGEHQLESGEVIATVNGKITEIKPKAEAEMSEDVTEDEIVADEATDVIEQDMAEDVVVVDAPEDLKGYIDGKIEELLAIIAELKSEIEAAKPEVEVELAKKPATMADNFAAFKRFK